MSLQSDTPSMGRIAPGAFDLDNESESFFDFGALPDFLGDTFRRTTEIAKTAAAIAGGNRDENSLTSELFYDRHPERNRRKIARSEQKAAREWLDIREQVVRPLLTSMPSTPAAPAAGSPVPSGPVSGKIGFKRGGWDGWKGLSSTPSLARIRPGSVSDTFGIAVAATSGVEGAFDKVQTYDRGILSWGIKQWTLHAGSLQKLLAFIQNRLAERGQSALWQNFFPGLSIRNGKELWYNGRRYASNHDLRRLIRNSTSQTSYDPDHMKRWMRRFVIAGRHPAIQEAQLAYAKQDLAARLKRLPRKAFKRKGRWRFSPRKDLRPIGHYLGTDGRTLAFFQSMVTQNPGFAMTLVATTVDKMRRKHGDESDWPLNWRSELQRNYEKEFSESGVACWGRRAKRGKSLCRKRKTRYQKTVESLARFARP
ncbi:MAG: hypothetical protein KJO82_16250 [Gammaproteobacteria bacterium]|nr:hypothetical protein [Gammaproteobacteria bacterium]